MCDVGVVSLYLFYLFAAGPRHSHTKPRWDRPRSKNSANEKWNVFLFSSPLRETPSCRVRWPDGVLCLQGLRRNVVIRIVSVDELRPPFGGNARFTRRMVEGAHVPSVGFEDVILPHGY